MERIKLTDRIIIDMRNIDNTPMDAYEIQQTLCIIGEKIRDGYSGGTKDTYIHEVQWEHETERFGGFRNGIVSKETMEEICDFIHIFEENQSEKYDYFDALDCAIGNLRTATELLTRVIEENKL